MPHKRFRVNLHTCLNVKELLKQARYLKLKWLQKDWESTKLGQFG